MRFEKGEHVGKSLKMYNKKSLLRFIYPKFYIGQPVVEPGPNLRFTCFLSMFSIFLTYLGRFQPFIGHKSP
jgi:hypothetical protein